MIRRWYFVRRSIEITFGFCAVLCVLLWLDIKMTLWFLFCILIHELGHWIALRLYRVRVTGLRLCLTGAVLETALLSYEKEMLCALAGPVFSAALGGLLLRRAPRVGILSFCLAAANLLPLYPMDGGRLLAALLSRSLPSERVEHILSGVGFVTCALLMLLACWGTIVLQIGLWPIFTALLLLSRAGDPEKLLLFLRKTDRIKN